MPSINDFPARGKITEIRNGVAIFEPAGTSYQLHLEFTGEAPPISMQPIEILIKVDARKVYTVPSGGNFIQPIFGPPRIIQGRVKFVENAAIVVHAGAPIICVLPVADSGIELSEGQITVGKMANVVALPGAKLQFAAVALR